MERGMGYTTEHFQRNSDYSKGKSVRLDKAETNHGDANRVCAEVKFCLEKYMAVTLYLRINLYFDVHPKSYNTTK